MRKLFLQLFFTPKKQESCQPKVGMMYAVELFVSCWLSTSYAAGGPQRNSLLRKELGIVKDIFFICKRGWHGLCYEDESKLGICVNNGVDV